MKFKTFDHSTNYTAQIVKLPPKQKMVGLDNLVSVNVFGNDCLISKDSPEDTLYVFFPAGTQLSEAFLKGNNLYRELQLNEDPTQTGFFEPNGRVKAIKFRGVISSGFITPVSSLKNAFAPGPDRDWAVGTINDLKEGDSFNVLDDEEICRKYMLPTKGGEQGVKGDKVSRINNRLANLLLPNQFRFHSETGHLANNLEKLMPNDMVVVTDKWHGSSCILSKVYISRKLNLWQRFVNLLGGQIPKQAFGYIYSSGKPKSNLPKGIIETYTAESPFFADSIKWENKNGDFYVDNIWKHAMKHYIGALEDGISLYGELVGFTESGQYIQKGYDYGCANDTAPSTCRFIVYRITYTKPNGQVIEFSWSQIKQYCNKYAIEHAKELFYGQAKNLTAAGWGDIEFWRTTVLAALTNQYNLEQNCVHCTNKVPAEGLILRIDDKPNFTAYKLKSKRFLKHESDELDAGVSNIEDAN